MALGRDISPPIRYTRRYTTSVGGVHFWPTSAASAEAEGWRYGWSPKRRGPEVSERRRARH